MVSVVSRLFLLPTDPLSDMILYDSMRPFQLTRGGGFQDISTDVGEVMSTLKSSTVPSVTD